MSRLAETPWDAETWVFDLDNTLYPPSSALVEQFSGRIGRFVADLLDLDLARARQMQKALMHEYGTTLRGLMVRHGVDPAAYMAAVYQIDYSVLEPAPRLATALAALPGRKIVFTNASTGHATQVLGRLGIADAFEAIFDIAAADYLPKPTPAIYDGLVGAHDIEPAGAVMVEDIARNLAPAAALGMTTVWIRGGHGWAQPEDGADYVHVEVDRLVDWLEGVAGLPAAPHRPLR